MPTDILELSINSKSAAKGNQRLGYALGTISSNLVIDAHQLPRFKWLEAQVLPGGP